MSISPKDIELVDRHIRGELSEMDRASFELRLNEDEELKKHFYEMQEIEVGIGNSVLNKKLDLLKQEEIRLKDSNSSGIRKLPIEQRKPSQILLVGKWLGIAASILLLGILIVDSINSRRYLNEVLNEKFEHYPSGYRVSRSIDGPLEQSSDLIRAVNLYEIRDYKSAAPLLEQYFQEAKDSSILLLAGISYLGNGNISKAKEILNLWENKKEIEIYFEIIEQIEK